MGKILRLALSNIRKSRSRSLSFLVIVLIAALLLNLGLITGVDYAGSFDEKAEQLNAPGVVLVAQNDQPSFIADMEQELRGDDRIAGIETLPALLAGSEFPYAGGINSRTAAFFDRSRPRETGRFSMTEELETLPQHPIYLPYLFRVGGGYRLGDPFTITLFTAVMGKLEHSFTVAGFYEDIYFATINSTVTGFLLDSGEYAALEQALGGAASGTLFSVNTRDAADNESIASHYQTTMGERYEVGRLTDSSHYALVKSSRTVTSSIGASIILGFSLLLLLVSLVVVNFRIRNSVEEEIRNIGALKALGYTSRQLIGAFLAQFLLLALGGVLLGILCSLPVLPGLAAMFASQTGIVWNKPFSPLAALMTLLVVEALVGAVAFISAVRIRRLPPIVALRTGLQTHSFRRNPLPLDRGNRPLTLSLAGKQMVRSGGQNLLIGLIVTGVTFAAMFAGVLFYNVNIESDVFIRMVSGEVPNAQLEAGDPEAAARLMERVHNMEQVDKAYFFSTESLICEREFEANAYILDDFEFTGNPDWLYQGRFPRYDNEVALGGLMARTLGKGIGDTVRLTKGDAEWEYLITGLIQGSNYMGHDLCLSQAAYQRLSPDFQPVVFSVYLRNREETGGFLQTLERESPDRFNGVNADEIIRSSMATYQSIVAVLAVIIGIVTLVVIGLVLYLVIKTLLVHKRRELGIQKAIGFTTGQLVLQNALAFLPVIVFGALLGGIGGYLGLNPFFSVLFSGIGIMKVNFVVSFPLLALVFGFIVLFGFGVSLLVATRIRRIFPYTLISE
jgi:putative ABC transport system permease protein